MNTPAAGDAVAAQAPMGDRPGPAMAGKDSGSAPGPGFDPSVPGPARMYDYGDIRAPQAILSDPVTCALIDFTRPVGVLFVAVLHFLANDDQPWEQVAFRQQVASGSTLAVPHITADGTPPEIQDTIRDIYAEASAPAVFRTRPEIESFFDGLDLLDLCVVEVCAWRSLRPTPPAPLRFLGGVAQIIPGCEQP